MRRWFITLLALGLLATACSSAGGRVAAPPTASPSTAAAESPAPNVVDSAVSPEPAPTSTIVTPAPSEPSATSEPGRGRPEVDVAGDIDLAPLGTYVVARDGAGIQWSNVDGQQVRLEIPVYDSPFGAPRTLLDVNEIDDVEQPVSLTNWSDGKAALVLRVIAGGPDDDWLIVQAPARPNNSYVWVRRSDFDFGFTDMRIEIDLAQGAGLTLFDGSDELLRTAIVHGRDSRPTPTHVTFIERGIRGQAVSPAYGTAILSMASFSEVLGTFGNGMPENFLHGTNQPELMGQRVSSGEIRVPNDILDQVIETIVPGTPVLMFDSSSETGNKQAIIERTLTPASTIDFLDGGDVAADLVTDVTPQLWHRCPSAEAVAAGQLLCRMGLMPSEQGRYAYITARPDAGEFSEEANANVIAVYDIPDGEPRTLVHRRPDGFDTRVALRNPAWRDEPLVLWPLEVTPDQEWIRVQAPIHPQRQSVWVRASDFEFGYTDYRVEIDIAGQGNLTLFDGDTELISNIIVSGREGRPTPLGASYIDVVVRGETLSPAFGSYLLSIPMFNDVLTTFGGVLPKQSIHGTNQPELMGQQVASGHVRLPNEVLTFMAEQPGGLVGARVVTVDSTSIDREQAIQIEESRPWTPATTTDPRNQEIELADPSI